MWCLNSSVLLLNFMYAEWFLNIVNIEINERMEGWIKEWINESMNLRINDDGMNVLMNNFPSPFNCFDSKPTDSGAYMVYFSIRCSLVPDACSWKYADSKEKIST